MGCWRISVRSFFTFVLIDINSFRGAFSFKAVRNFFTSLIYCRCSNLKYSVVRLFIHNQFTQYIIFYKSITIYIPPPIMACNSSVKKEKACKKGCIKSISAGAGCNTYYLNSLLIVYPDVPLLGPLSPLFFKSVEVTFKLGNRFYI